jgi:hypothetical protein
MSKRKRRHDNKPCSVVKLADTPSYLGGEEQWDKLRLFGAATNHFVEVQVLPLQLIEKGGFLPEVAFFAFSTYTASLALGYPLPLAKLTHTPVEKAAKPIDVGLIGYGRYQWLVGRIVGVE